MIRVQQNRYQYFTKYLYKFLNSVTTYNFRDRSFKTLISVRIIIKKKKCDGIAIKHTKRTIFLKFLMLKVLNIWRWSANDHYFKTI